MKGPWRWLLIALTLLPWTLQAETVRRALVFYHEEGAAGTERLRFARSDAERMKQVLTEQGGLSAQGVTVLARPTPTQVLEALDALTRKVEADRARGNTSWLWVYYSGHADAQGLELGRQLLPMDTLERAVAGTGAQVRIVVLDACASGSMTRTRGGTPAPPFVVRLDTGSVEGQVILTSSSESEAAQESDRIGGGVFTHHLLTGLRGAADRSGDGAVSLAEVYAYAHDATLLDTLDSSAGVQHPSFKIDLSGQGDLILTHAQGTGGALEFPTGTTGHFLVFDARAGAFVAEMTLEGQARRLGLPPGTYWVQKREAERLKVAEVTIPRGGTVPLREATMSSQRYEDDLLKGAITTHRRMGLGSRLELSTGVVYQSFFAHPELDVAEELIPATPLLTSSLRLAGWPAPGLALRMDMGLTVNDEVLQTEPYPLRILFTEGQAGVAVVRTWERGRAEVAVGPRLAGIYLRRSFPWPLEQPTQTFFGMTPGVVGTVGVELTDAWGLSLEGRAHYLYFYAGDVDLSLGYLEGGLSLRARF